MSFSRDLKFLVVLVKPENELFLFSVMPNFGLRFREKLEKGLCAHKISFNFGISEYQIVAAG